MAKNSKNHHLLPGALFIGSVVIGMFALVQARELRQKKPSEKNDTFTTTNTKKKTLEELVEEVQAKYPPEQDYEMKKTLN